MPVTSKGEPVRFNVDTVIATARRLAAGADANKPLLVTSDGRVETGEPTRAVPDRWIRAKADLANVPLIGRLPAIREAARLVRAAQLRDNFQTELTTKFGSDVAAYAFSSDSSKPPKATLNSRKIVKVLNKAQERAVKVGRQNDAAFDPAEPSHDPGAAVVDRYARLLGIATHGGYFRQSLDAQTCDGLRATAQSELQGMCEQSGRSIPSSPLGGLPATFDAVLRAYEKRLAKASAADQPGIATECLTALANLATIVAVQPNAGQHAPCAEDIRAVQLLCARAAGEDEDRYSPEVAKEAWQELMQTKDRLREELPELSDDALAGVFHEITAGHSSMSPATLLEASRKQLIITEMKRQFDPSDAESMLWNAVIEATAKLPGDHSLTVLMTTLAKEMLLDVDFRAPALAQHFNCEDHLPTIIEKTREQLIKNTSIAAQEHIAALQLIDESEALTPAQKTQLKSYAAGDVIEKRAPQRLSPVQIEQLTTIADTIARRMPQIKQADAMGEPAVLFDSMAEISATFQEGMGKILSHAESMWVSRSFDGTDTEQRMFELCVRLAAAKLQDSPSELPVQCVALSAPHAHERFYDTTVRQFLNACNQSPSMYVSKFAMFYGDVTRLTEEAAEGDAQQPPPSLRLTRPELLVRTLAHPSGSADEGGALDQRGVLTDSPNGALVAANFRLDAVVNLDRHEFQPSSPQPPETLAGMFGRIVDRAHIFIHGRRLIGDTKRWQESVGEIYESAFEKEPAGIDAAIAACMASNALPNFVADVNAAAFEPPMTMANLRGAHEIWRDPDGAWYVRSTHVSSPMGQGGKTVRTDGVVLYTLTHRIEPAQGDGAPRVSLHDSNAVFAF